MTVASLWSPGYEASLGAKSGTIGTICAYVKGLRYRCRFRYLTFDPQIKDKFITYLKQRAQAKKRSHVHSRVNRLPTGTKFVSPRPRTESITYYTLRDQLVSILSIVRQDRWLEPSHGGGLIYSYHTIKHKYTYILLTPVIK